MIDTFWIRASLVAGAVGLGLAGTYAVSGCGSGTQENPPATQAQAGSTPPSRTGAHHHHTPPPAAFDACKSKAVGDACTVAWHDGEIQGKCAAPPEGAPQSGPACRPEGHRGRHHGPPPEVVFAACDGKTEGDS